MENKLKRCQQCGEHRNLDQFRQYYNRNKTKKEAAFYKTCKVCESINQRHKYLTSKLNKGTITEAETDERNIIEELYETLRAAGLKPPAKKQESNVVNLVQEMMDKRRADIEAKKEAGIDGDTPQELLEWLTKDLSGYDPEELERVSERLERTYRPQIGLDPETSLPVHDDKYRGILLNIQERFDEYEDSY
jgi:hypothetical protein